MNDHDYDFEEILQQSNNAIVITNLEGDILWVNNTFCKHSEYSREELIGQNPRLLSSGYHEESFYKNLWDTIIAGNHWYGKIINKTKSDKLYIDSLHIFPLKDENKNNLYYVAIRTNVIFEGEVIKGIRDIVESLTILDKQFEQYRKERTSNS